MATRALDFLETLSPCFFYLTLSLPALFSPRYRQILSKQCLRKAPQNRASCWLPSAGCSGSAGQPQGPQRVPRLHRGWKSGTGVIHKFCVNRMWVFQHIFIIRQHPPAFPPVQIYGSSVGNGWKCLAILKKGID